MNMIFLEYLEDEGTVERESESSWALPCLSPFIAEANLVEVYQSEQDFFRGPSTLEIHGPRSGYTGYEQSLQLIRRSTITLDFSDSRPTFPK